MWESHNGVLRCRVEATGLSFEVGEACVVRKVKNAAWDNRLVRVQGELAHPPSAKASKVGIARVHDKAFGAIRPAKLVKLSDAVVAALHADDRKLLERLGTRQVVAPAATDTAAYLATIDEMKAVAAQAGYDAGAADANGDVLFHRRPAGAAADADDAAADADDDGTEAPAAAAAAVAAALGDDALFRGAALPTMEL